jgi:hypothetical protein
MEQRTTEAIYEVVGQTILAATCDPWDQAVLDFLIWDDGTQHRPRQEAAGQHDRPLELTPDAKFEIDDAMRELCYRMTEAGHEWNVATYRLTPDLQMTINFSLRDEPWAIPWDEKLD